MTYQGLLLLLGLALTNRLLVGIERHWRQHEAAPGSRTEGLGWIEGLPPTSPGSIPNWPG